MDSTTTIFDLGDDMMIEIFLRLPLESIFQYLSVSKQWNSLLASPEFLSHYSRRFHDGQRTRSPHNLLGFFLDISSSGASATRVPFLSTQQSRIGRENFSSDMGSFITSSNGLVLCRRGHTHPRSYHILNPMTRKHVSLPPLRRKYDFWLSIGLSCDSDDLTPRYEVVIADVLRMGVGSKELCIQTYSSETKEWRKSVLVATSDVRPLRLYPPTVLNGVFYWWVFPDFVAVYDPHNKQGGNKDPNHLQLIQLPADHACDLDHVLYQTPDGRLIFGRASNGRIKLWELSTRELGFWRETTIYKQEWALIYEVPCERGLELVALIPCNPLILLVRQGSIVFQFNTETKVMKHIVLLPENHTVGQPFFEAISFSSYLLA